MSKSDLTDIQRSLNIIRGELDKSDWQTRLRALEMMMTTSQSVIAAARKMTTPKRQPLNKAVVVPKVKTVKQKAHASPPAQLASKSPPDLTPQKPVPPVG